jgi:hypothetical protein
VTWKEQDHLSPAERQALAFQAILRVYLTAPDHCVEQRVMDQVEIQRESLKDLDLEGMLTR